MEIRDGKPSEELPVVKDLNANQKADQKSVANRVFDRMTKSAEMRGKKPAVASSSLQSKNLLDLITCRICHKPAKDIAFKGDWRDGRISYVCPECQAKLLASGQIIHGYEIISVIGEGGMGKVYKARHINLDVLRAVKVLNPSLTQNKERLIHL